jgi:hypothetical protein
MPPATLAGRPRARGKRNEGDVIGQALERHAQGMRERRCIMCARFRGVVRPHRAACYTGVIDADDFVAAEQVAPALVSYLREAVLPDRQEAAEREAARNRQLLEANPSARINWHDRNFLERWWQLGYRRADMVAELSSLHRYIALSRVAIEDRESPYVFVASDIRPADALQVFAVDDDYSFGILHSTYHRMYFEERCSKMRVTCATPRRPSSTPSRGRKRPPERPRAQLLTQRRG